MQAKERLIAVSNRLPVTLRHTENGWKVQRSAGGLATAMDPILKQTGGIWIGWPGDPPETPDPEREEALRNLAAAEHCIAVDLPPDIARLFYEEYSNQTLWPLFHQFPMLVRFHPDAWQAYVQANTRFRDAVVDQYKDGDLVWVHDYHLMLLPQMLREAIPTASIGFFLHIPFPSSEVFRILPRRDEVLSGLLGADLLAFHTHSHLQHFRSTLLRVLGIESRLDRVEIGARAVRLEALPIGIDPQLFADALGTREARAYRAELDRRFSGRRIIVAVDRLDYTKGIPHRLRAYRRLLKDTPELRGQVVMIQVAVPSREQIATYSGLRREVSELVGDINGQFSTPDWTPLVYLRRDVPRPQLAALYGAADVAWVTPLRDGMNLVAKEYAACKADGNGALVLSEFAGAAEEMGEAFSVNPYDFERTAEIVRRALSLMPEERRSRMSALHSRVVRNNVFAWGERFLGALRSASSERAQHAAEIPACLDERQLIAAYAGARRRALFLDYDGTLAGYAPRPEDAKPRLDLLEILERLTADLANSVCVISGRRREDLGNWFGGLQRLWLVAEHGALIRAPSESWEPLRPSVSPDWKERVRPMLEHFVERTPGSLIEEKEYSLAWHYRLAEPEFGKWLANELLAILEGLLADTELRAIQGRMVVEVRPIWASKREAVQRLLQIYGDTDFRLAAGDDRTDEDMFAALDAEAWTVRVGYGPSKARFSVRNAGEVRAVLRAMTEERPITRTAGD